MPSAHYILTRRKGQLATVSLHDATTTNPQTLEREESRTVHNLRRVVKQPTTYSRIAGARTALRDVGETTFIFWLKDITFRRLTPEDYIVFDGVRYDFVESSVEEDGLVATAKAILGATPIQVVQATASNSMLSDSAGVE